MDLGVPPVEIRNLLGLKPLKSRFLVCELTVWQHGNTGLRDTAQGSGAPSGLSSVP